MEPLRHLVHKKHKVLVTLSVLVVQKKNKITKECVKIS